ncbi:MAG: DASH family cryptochrome [Bacilli bacterium]
MKTVNLVYFQHDLRIEDHPGLTLAQQQALPIVGLYILPPEDLKETQWGFKKIGRYRFRFLIESLKDLKTQLANVGIPLLVFHASSEQVATKLLTEFSIQHVFHAFEPGLEEQTQTKALLTALGKPKVTVSHDKPLLSPKAYPWLLTQLPPRYTDARMKIEAKIIVQPLLPPLKNQPPIQAIADDLPTLEGLVDKNIQPFMLGGSTFAKQHLHDYFFTSRRVLTYKFTRNNLLAFADSSKLSPALALGLLSPRMVYWQLKKVENTIEKNQSTYWLWFELLWRDYFYYLHCQHPQRFFLQTGILSIQKTWSMNPAFLQAVLNAKTGYPLVDANLMELYQTGWMSNRGRQNVASFLSKTLQLDWRWGAALFEHYLMDYDVSSNYGNWQYISGVGTDPREDRIFNVSLQAKKYDPKGEYLRHWLPALKHVPTPEIFEPWKMNALAMSMYQCQIGEDYPFPIVHDRRVQLND